MDDVITVRLPTTFEQARLLIDFIERRSDILHEAMRYRAARTRFPLLVCDATWDREVYGLCSPHRRLAFADPAQSTFRRIPSATLAPFLAATRADLDDLIARRLAGDRGVVRMAGHRDNVIALANLTHLEDDGALRAWIDHAKGTLGVAYVVALVRGDADVGRPRERHGNVMLL